MHQGNTDCSKKERQDSELQPKKRAGGKKYEAINPADRFAFHNIKTSVRFADILAPLIGAGQKDESNTAFSRMRGVAGTAHGSVASP